MIKLYCLSGHASQNARVEIIPSADSSYIWITVIWTKGSREDSSEPIKVLRSSLQEALNER